MASSVPSSGSSSNTSSTTVQLTGSCFCKNLKYQLYLRSKDDAPTSLCHCGNCKKAFGGAFAVTCKVPLEGFRYAKDSGKCTLYKGENELGNTLYREFCHKCGSCICQYGEQARQHFRYIALGSIDDPSALSPKGEFYCSERESWLPQIPDISQKQNACFIMSDERESDVS